MVGGTGGTRGGRRRRNNILGGEGKEENDGAKRRTLKRGERRSRSGGGGAQGHSGIADRSQREDSCCEAYDVVKTSTFFYRWTVREGRGERRLAMAGQFGRSDRSRNRLTRLSLVRLRDIRGRSSWCEIRNYRQRRQNRFFYNSRTRAHGAENLGNEKAR